MEEWGNWLFFAIGMVVAHIYNGIAWRKYYEGRDGRKRCTLRERRDA